MSKVLIVIKSGTITSIRSTEDLEITIVDLDNKNIGENFIETLEVFKCPDEEFESLLKNISNDNIS